MKIRKSTPQDWPRLLDLIRIVHNDHVYEKAVQRFEWQYEKNPQNTPESPLIFIAEEGNRITGMIGAFAQKLKIGDSIYPAFWVGDYMVHPDFRGSVNAIKLAKKIALHPGLMLGFPAEKTIKLWLRAKATQFSQLAEYSKYLGYMDLVKGILSSKSKEEIKIIKIKKFDARFDSLWEKISKTYPACQVRDSSFLNWRFFQCPHLTYRVLAAVKENEIRGYIVLREEVRHDNREGDIIDLFADRSDSALIGRLIQAGMVTLKKNGCNAVKMIISSDDKMMDNFLRQFSFSLLTKKERGIIFNNTAIGLDPIIKDPNNWFLTKADSDIDFS